MSEAADTSAAALPIGEQLCTACGLCCNGALHDYAVLEPGEQDLAARLGLTLVPGNDERFGLPCPRLEGTLCGTFGDRPQVCGRYRCGLLISLDEASVDLEGARAHVATAHGLLRRLKDEMPEGMTFPEARALLGGALHPEIEAKARDRLAGDPEQAQRIRLFSTALAVYLDRHFREERKGKTLTMTPVTRGAS